MWKIIINSAIAVGSQIALPFAINMATAERGYRAVGGEYIFVVIGVFATVLAISSIIGYYNKRLSSEKDRKLKLSQRLWDFKKEMLQDNGRKRNI
jgi:hypothetical protein